MLTRRDRAALEAERKRRKHAARVLAYANSLPPDDREWRAVVGFEGRYEVSADGRVRTVLTRVAERYKADLRIRVGSRGYLVVSLRDAAGKSYLVAVHKIVARAFLGPCPPGMQVAHNDGTRTNANASNLRYATPAENQADRVAHGTDNFGDRNPARMRPERLARGERNGASKLTGQAVRELRADHGRGLGQKRLARKYGVSQATVWDILAGKIWRHVV